MKISVITVCYNSEATIADTIASFLQQDHPDKELLIVDGASKDNTLKIAQSFAAPEIRIFSEPDKGAYDAMNKGLRLFGGDAAGILNSDDTFHDAHVLSRIADALGEADIAYGDLDLVEDHEKKHVVREWRSGAYGRWSYQLGWVVPHPTFYARRKVIETVGEFDLSYRIAADYDFMLRAMALNDFRIRYIPHVLVDFKMGGISTNNWKATLDGNLECLRSRRVHLRVPAIDAAFFLRPLRRIFQLRRSGFYLSR